MTPGCRFFTVPNRCSRFTRRRTIRAARRVNDRETLPSRSTSYPSRTAMELWNERTYCRYGTLGNRWSTHSAASSFIRRPAHEGQLDLDLHENGTRSSSPHRRQFRRRNPCSKSPHRSTPSRSSSANFGNEAPFSSARSMNDGRCSRTSATRSEVCVLRGSYLRAAQEPTPQRWCNLEPGRGPLRFQRALGLGVPPGTPAGRSIVPGAGQRGAPAHSHGEAHEALLARPKHSR